MAHAIKSFVGLRAVNQKVESRTTTRAAPIKFSVEANKKGNKKCQVVLTQDVKYLGQTGDLVVTSNGYFRNYLAPFQKAKAATAEILQAIQDKEDVKAEEKAAVKATATQLSTALRTIGKFAIKVKVADGGNLYASVTTRDVVEAVKAQTSQVLNEAEITLPAIDEIGTYDVSVALHPEVTARFQLDVQKQT